MDEMDDKQEKQDKAHSYLSVRVDVLCVEVSGSGQVVIGVGIV